jgi:RNA recognition motif-containing protein
MEPFVATTARSGEAFQTFFCPDNVVEQLQIANGKLQEENSRLASEMEDLRKQLEQYKVVSQSFEKRVLDLQKEIKTKEEELAALRKADDGFQLTVGQAREASTKAKECTTEDGAEPEQFRKLFVGGLSYSTTDDSLREYFSKFGELIDCVVMKDSATKRSRGFGFVVYTRISMVDAAQAARPHVVDGREVETKRAVPKGEPLHRENQVRVRKIFVGGLKETTDETILSEYFSQYGRVDHVDLIEDRATKRLRGFAYVTFNDYDPVDKAVLQKYHTIDGRRCEVKKALSKMEMRSLKDAAGFTGHGAPWPVGSSCLPNGSNMCNIGPANNFGSGCNVGGFVPSCGFGGPGPNVANCGSGMNSMGQGWNQCGGWNRCGGAAGSTGNWNNAWCGDGFHGWSGADQYGGGGNFHGNKDGNSSWCRSEHPHRGGCRGGPGGGNDGGRSYQRLAHPAASPNGFVSD